MKTRSTPYPREAGKIISGVSSDVLLKLNEHYLAAKAGDTKSAMILVDEMVSQASIEAARYRFGTGVAYLPVMAQELTGHNQIPNMLAAKYASATGACVATGIFQVNRAFHTGANAMERLLARAEFDGVVQQGQSYVLVDDVSTMGSTLADMASYIQQHGGHVTGAVVLVNSSRSGIMSADSKLIKELEVRHGQELSNIFRVEPSALTQDEARYPIGFRSTEELRNRAAKAIAERRIRISTKALSRSAGNLTSEYPASDTSPPFI